MTKYKAKIIIFFTLLILISSCVWLYLSYTKINNAFANSISVVNPVKIVYENPCDYPTTLFKEIDAEEAIYRAECFIIENGYTDLPPVSDKRKLTPENVFPLDDEEGMKMRYNSLERKAYNYDRDEELYGGSWVIGFRLMPTDRTKNLPRERFNSWGRAVVMDLQGNNIRILHTGIPLNMPKATIINP